MAKKVGVMARFKQMLKDYWYIIIPVEIGTSIIWYGTIFISLKSGMDIVHLLESVGVSETALAKLPIAGGEAGYHALAFVCYKVISPISHTISIGITAAVVSWLQKTRPGFLTSSSIAKDAKEKGEDMREMYEEKKAEGKERMDELKMRAQESREDMKDRYDEKVAEGKEMFDDLRTRADEKRSDVRKNFDEKVESWKKRKHD